MTALVMDMVREFGRAGYADYLEANDMVETFINTLKMEPHYGGGCTAEPMGSDRLKASPSTTTSII